MKISDRSVPGLGGPRIPGVNLKLLKVFYVENDEHEIISTLFYIHKDLDACLIRTAEDTSNIIDETPCIKKVRGTNPYVKI